MEPKSIAPKEKHDAVVANALFSDATLSEAMDVRVPLELLIREDRIYFNFWDAYHGNDVACQVRDGKIMRFVYTEDEANEANEPLKQEEISFQEFINLVKESLSKRQA